MSNRLKVKAFLIGMNIILCLILLMATTYGLFTSTDEVNLRVTSGNMDMDLLLYDKEVGDYVSIKNGKGDVFGSGKWEPNQTRIIFLKVKNDSNINVKYLLRMDTLIGELGGALEYVALESDYFDAYGSTWEDTAAMGEVRLLKNGFNPISGEEYIAMKPGDAHTFALAVHMRADSTNEYQRKKCIVDINLFATQGNAD